MDFAVVFDVFGSRKTKRSSFNPEIRMLTIS